MAKRAFLAELSMPALWVFVLVVPLAAQVGPTPCPCGEQRDFGSCVVTQQQPGLTYPGEFPGSAAVVASAKGEDVTYLYIPDLFSGFTYRYDGKVNGGILAPGTPAETLISPEGSRSTTGLTYHPTTGLLYWAIDNRLVTTDLDLRQAEVIGPVDLEGLQTALGLPQRGALGGITYHQERQTFWGVDIVNDIYFEFNESGELQSEGGKPVHFKHPLLTPFGGGAYGNGITYASVAGVSYFDLPVGSLVDGNASRVVRVHAAPGGEGERAFKIGDPAGLFYELGPTVGPHGFISGIVYWPSTCDPSNHTEILLGIPLPNSGDAVRIYQVSVDDPQAATLPTLEAAASGNNVTLSWKPLRPYGRLELKRRLLPSGNLVDVVSFTSFAADPRQYIDRNVGDGLYEYIARVTPPAPSPRKFPDVKQRVIVGRGAIAAHADYRLPSPSRDDEPFAITFIGSQSRVLVADRATGHAHLFRTDLSPAGTLAGPFVGAGLEGGLVTGVAWDSASDSLFWVLWTTGGSFLQKTSLSGASAGPRASIDVPFNLRRTPAIGDLSFDPFKRELWAIDRENMLAYSFNDVGDLTGSSSTVQLPVPRVPDGEFGGGVAVVESDGSHLVLDAIAGRASTGGPNELVRLSYNRTGPAGENVSPPGAEVLTIPLRDILQAAEIGGTVAVKEGDENFEYVVGVDTRRLYKLRMDSGIQGVEFKRGEVNNDGGLPNISDAIYLLNFLFKSGPALPCEDAADLNDDESLTVSDPVALFSYLFRGGAPPPPPFTTCGRDFDPPLICRNQNCS